MKKSILFTLIITWMMGVLFTSCVSTKKYLSSELKVNKLRIDSTAMRGQMNNCNAQVKNLNDEKSTLQTENTNLKTENTAIQTDLKSLATESKMTIADQAKQLKTFQNLVQSQKKVMAALKNSISDALMNYKADELSVNIKNGNVYVSLEEKLLFKSGSDKVDPKGKEALKSLAKVLRSAKDITVEIEGHTDNVPIKTKQFTDNWDLSTSRANSIVRILTKDYGFDSKRITASGRGTFHPVKTNKTAEGRSSNRRTEVILSPDLKELYKLMDQ